MDDQFAEVKPGDRLAGWPSRPWNKLLDLVRPNLGGDRNTPGKPTTGVEVLVRNATGGPLDAYAVLGIVGALNTSANDPDGFKALDSFTGNVPTSSSVIAILQNAVPSNGVGFCRVLGRSACKVNLTDVTHRYAVPTASTAELTSAASGPVRILDIENNFGGVADGLWAVVLLLQTAPGGNRFARFTLAAGLAMTDASQANCHVDEFWGGASPGATVTVWNLPASTNYIFSGPATAKGLATYDDVAAKWYILQLECSGSTGGGGGTGFTGTIGN